jgi:hypothetical protein
MKASWSLLTVFAVASLFSLRVRHTPAAPDQADTAEPDADLPDGDVPDADVPDGDVPDSEPPDAGADGEPEP